MTEREVVVKWAKDMARRIGGPDEGWGLWSDWLQAFLSDVRRAQPESGHVG